MLSITRLAARLCPLAPVLLWCCATRYEVYICTAAQRAYAEVVWTLLDPRGSVFSHQELSWRLLTVPAPGKKDLLNVLRACSTVSPTRLLSDAGVSRGFGAWCRG